MKRGEIWDVDLPPPPGEPGSEQQGGRPAIVMTIDAVRQVLALVIVVPLTKQLKAQHYPGTVLIQQTPGNGLDMDSIALTFQARALDKNKRFISRRGELSKRDLQEIERQLKLIMGL